MVLVHGHEEREVAVAKHLVLALHQLRHLLDVLHRHPVGRVGHGLMPLLLGHQPSHLRPLPGNHDDLVVDDAVRVGALREEGEQVHRDGEAVDDPVMVRLYLRGDGRVVHVDDGEALDHGAPVDLEIVIGAFEVGHGDGSLLEVEGHIAVDVLLYLLLVEHVEVQSLILEDLYHFLHLEVERLPFLGVVFPVRLLGDDQVGGDLHVGSPLVVVEIRLREELRVLVTVVVVVLLAENILFLQARVFSQRLQDVHVDAVEVIVFLDVGAELKDGVHRLDDDGIVPVLVIQHGVEEVPLLIILVAQRGIDVVENLHLLYLAHFFSFLIPFSRRVSHGIRGRAQRILSCGGSSSKSFLDHEDVVVHQAVPAFPLVVQSLLLLGPYDEVSYGHHDQQEDECHEEARCRQQYQRSHHGHSDDARHPSQEPASDSLELQWSLKSNQHGVSWKLLAHVCAWLPKGIPEGDALGQWLVEHGGKGCGKCHEASASADGQHDGLLIMLFILK